MTFIHLARHATHDEVGHILSGRSDIALNPKGEAEALALAAEMSAVPLDRIYTSPRRRATQTAGAVGTMRGIDPLVAPALDEIDFGTFTGRSFAALEDDRDWQAWNRERATARCPGGETMEEAIARAADFIFGLAQADAPVLCVTHCDIIRGLVAHMLAMPMDRMFMLGCDPASVTTLAIDHGDVRLVTLNRCARR
ncbi:histidine phosphatase family protein [Novosphingobium sp. FGD1]|uniref:Histidine phosphatase family protein n=1 Tax=Novosphingobium silvae TaxID=2692619 RepID=A0A7X4K931_9SPHN|nr:histidine phosphatase family protein [Novosphingobium silvae]MYL99637.1 histidine phosphatase family protein [Novosphingobium silvae]